MIFARLKAELALIFINPAPTTTHPEKFIFQHFSVNDDQVSLDEWNRSLIWRRPQLFRQTEDDLNFIGKW